ncbi:MAG: D-2-hydroxyacid dehydrogenase, partial [Muribaculaceae bacterium]|nr:D-2-hydroxyacid dehydrogenase [Muribaculaceae bacterium]
VAEALRDGRLHAFCADVLSTEPPSPDNPLLSAPRSYITPHIAWASVEARHRLLDTAVANLQAFVSGNPINNVAR